MGVVLIEEPLILRRAGAIGLRIAPAVEQIAAVAGAASFVPRRFGRRGGVVDDPDFAELPSTKHHLIELGIVGDGIAVDPVRQKAGELYAAGRADVADPFQPVQRIVLGAGLLRLILFRLGLVRRRAGKAGQIGEGRAGASREVHVNQFGVRGDIAEVVLCRVDVLNQMVPQMSFPDDLSSGLSRRLNLIDGIDEHVAGPRHLGL